MAIYATFSEEAGEQIASNHGWSEFCTWVDGANAANLAHLVQHGYCLVEPLLAEMQPMEVPPGDVGTTFSGLLTLLRDNAAEEAVFATDGMTSEDVENAGYFASCARDKMGHCLLAGGKTTTLDKQAKQAERLAAKQQRQEAVAARRAERAQERAARKEVRQAARLERKQQRIKDKEELLKVQSTGDKAKIKEFKDARKAQRQAGREERQKQRAKDKEATAKHREELRKAKAAGDKDKLKELREARKAEKSTAKLKQELQKPKQLADVSHHEPKYDRDNGFNRKDIYDYVGKALAAGHPASAVQDRLAELAHANASPATTNQQHGMGEPERMHRVKVDGVALQYAANNKTALGYSMAEMSRPGTPEKLWKSIDYVTFTKQRNKDDAYWETAYNMPGFKSHATGGEGGIVVYNGAAIGRSDLLHESGHVFASDTWGSTSPPRNSKYAEAHRNEPVVSDYAKNGINEDFAEATKFFVQDNAGFKKSHPQKHAALEELYGVQA